MAPIGNVIQIRRDMTLTTTLEEIQTALGNSKADLVVCDGAPDVTGLHDMDFFLQSQLLYCATKIAVQLLKIGGTFIAKVFMKPDMTLLTSQLQLFFKDVTYFKPPSSRASSRESFLLARNFIGKEPLEDPEVISFLECGSLEAYS